jgi:hypothetical protein
MIEITCEFQFNFRTSFGDTLLCSIMITACPFCIRLFSMSVTVATHVSGGEIISYAATNGPIIHPPNDSLHGYEELGCNCIDTGKPKNSEKNLSRCHFAHHKSYMD